MSNGETSKDEYMQLFNEIIQQQCIILGPDISIIIAKKVDGLIFSEDGKVTDFQGDGQPLLQKLINGFVNLSGMIVRKTIEPLLAKHPAAAAKVTGQPAGSIQTPQTPLPNPLPVSVQPQPQPQQPLPNEQSVPKEGS